MDTFGDLKANIVVENSPLQGNSSDVVKQKVSLKPLLFSFLITLVVCFLFYFGFKKWNGVNLLIDSGSSIEKTLVLNEASSPNVETATQTDKGIVLMPTIKSELKQDVYRDDELGFEINSPIGWYTDSTKKTGASVVFLNPSTEVINTNAFATFISVTVGETGGVLLSEQIKVTKKNILNDYPTYMIENDKEVVLGGRVYRLLEGYYYVKNVKIKNRSLITIYNQKGYAISATAPEISWDKSALAIDMSMNTFKLL